MALSQIELCSRALLKVGANSISSFEEGTVEAEIAACLYPTIRDALLSAHPWNFATTQKRLALLATPPLADYQCALQLPMDCIRVLSAGTDGRGSGLTYKIVQRQLLTDVDDVILTYIFRPLEADFPPFFDITLISYLAAEFCIPLADSTARWESLSKAAAQEFHRSRLIDAQEETPESIDEYSLIEGRY